MSTRFLNVCAALAILVLTIYVLIIGQTFLMPLVLAIVVWYLIVSLRRAIENLSRVGIPVPYPIALTIAVGACVLVLYLIYVLINSSVNELIASAPRYQDRFQSLVKQAYALLGLSQEAPLESIFRKINLTQIATQLARLLTSIASDIGLIIIYVIFMLAEHRTFTIKMDAMSESGESRRRLRHIVEEISLDINTYMRIKTWLSILTGLLSYAVMKVVGVDLAEFWAVIIFLLNYIPTIGSILGVLFPTLLMFVQFSNGPLVVGVAFVLLAIQVVVGNVLEPRMMGRSLNLSSLVIILSLTLWSAIWGVLGMFLCVPVMVILNIVLAKFPQTRPIAILMSADGLVDGPVRRAKADNARPPAPGRAAAPSAPPQPLSKEPPQQQ